MWNTFLYLCIINAVRMLPQAGSRTHNLSSTKTQSSSSLPIHPLNYYALVTGTGVKLKMPRKTEYFIRESDRASVRFVFNTNATRTAVDTKLKSLPQIVPLPPPRKFSGSGGRDGDTESRMIAFYTDFITEFVLHKGWSSAFLILPSVADGSNRSFELCNYFKATLLRSKAALQTECRTDADINIVNEIEQLGKVNNPQSNTRLIVPIFSFYFLRGKNKTDSRGGTVDPRLLINYVPSTPIFVLAGDESKEYIVDRLQPEFQANYKWTLVSFSNSYKNRTIMMILDDVYGFATSLEPITHPIGTWTPNDGVQIDVKSSHGPSDFQGRTLRITTVSGPPVVYVDKSSGKVKCRGYLPDILDILSRRLNFTYEVMTPSDNKFGNVDSNGTWNGMVGLLQKKEAEIALMSFSLTASRKTVMDFSPPVEYSSVRLLIRRDWMNAELKWSVFLQPLHSSVWIAIPICICLGVITLAAFAHWKILEMTPFSSAWLLTSCFVLQGQDEHSSIKVTPYRWVLGTFWMLSVVVFACYTARLTSFLAATTETLPIKSLSQAVKNKHWKVGLVKGSAFIDRIKESRVDVLRELHSRLADDPSSLVESFDDGMERVFKERFIFFTSELIPSFLIKGNCSYTWLPDKYFSGFGYMGFQKHLPFAPVISHKVAELRQSGSMQRLFRKWWGTESLCFSSDSFLGMSLYETGTAFLILILGTSFSITLLVAEFYRRPRSSILKKTELIASGHSQNTLPSIGSQKILKSSAASNTSNFNRPIKSEFNFNSDFAFSTRRKYPDIYY